MENNHDIFSAEENIYDSVRKNICTCAIDMEITPDIEEFLKKPMKEMHVSIPVRMDDGTIKTFQGFRVQYNNARGPTKGGIRYHPDESADTIRGLAAIMAMKCALNELPLGGAKGGIICNPKEMSDGETERMSRSYIQALGHFIGPDTDIPAPDVYTDSRIMGWMADEYCKCHEGSHFEAITGKPLSLGGSEGRSTSTARGGWFTVREAAKEMGLELEEFSAGHSPDQSSGEKKPTVAVQGFGNVGYNAALIGKENYDCRIVALSDSRGGIYSEEGFDPRLVMKFKAENKTLTGYPGAKSITNGELLELDVDILIPAALEHVITDENAGNVKAKILAEFANGPVTTEGEEILLGNNIHIIPDILCNGGGVIVSYYEMVQNLNMDHWDEDYVNKRLDRKMTKTYHKVLASSKLHSISMRKAAYTMALNKLVEAMSARGWI